MACISFTAMKKPFEVLLFPDSVSLFTVSLLSFYVLPRLHHILHL